MLKCERCNKIFQRQCDLSRHLNNETCLKEKACPTCGLKHNKAKFCSKSCSAKFNNLNKSFETKEKQRTTLLKTLGIDFYQKIEKVPKNNPIKTAAARKVPFTYIKKCNICEKYFNYSERKSSTCSDECFIRGKHKNSGRKSLKYKGLSFDSTWEIIIAKFLDENNIVWEQVKVGLPWIDKNNKIRKYFPDFYLPKYNLYLDPKNHLVIKKQQEKVNFFSKLENFIIGDVSFIMARMTGLEPACLH